MKVEADRRKHQVTIRGDRGTEITLTWASASLLGSLLKEASLEAAPPTMPGKVYAPAIERDRR